MSVSFEDAKALIRQDKLAEGLEALKQLMKAGAGPEILNDAGVCSYLLGDFEAGISLFEEALKKRPGFSLSGINKFYLEKVLEMVRNMDIKFRSVNSDGLDPKTPRPKVSVIVRTYNRPELLAKALESLKSQTFKEFETIVINDGGAQSAEQVSRDAGLAGLRYYRAPHGGPSAALNRGLEMARGGYIAFLDDDDIVYPNHLEVLVNRLDKAGKPGLAYPQVKINYFDKKGRLTKSVLRGIPDIDLRKCLRWDPIVSMLVLVSRECFEKLGMFIESLVYTAHDQEMWIRIRKNYPFYYIPELSAEWEERERPDRATRQGLFETYYSINLMLYYHRAVPLFSFPKSPANEKDYAVSIKELDRLTLKYPDMGHKLELYVFYHSKTMYGYFYDRYKIWRKFGDLEAAKDLLLIALKLRPFEPKLWIGYLSSIFADKKGVADAGKK